MEQGLKAVGDGGIATEYLAVVLNVSVGGWDWRVFVERANGVVKVGVDSCVKGRWKETR